MCAACWTTTSADRARPSPGPPSLGLAHHLPAPSSSAAVLHTLLSIVVLFYSSDMDALKAEIANKRKALEIPAVDGRPTKYIRRGDLERLKEEQERKAREAEEERRRQEKEREEREREEERRRKEAKKVSLGLSVVRALVRKAEHELENRTAHSVDPPLLHIQRAARPPPQRPHSTFQTRRLSVDSAPRASPFASSASPTRSAACVSVPWSSSRRKTTNVMEVRMTSRRRSRTWTNKPRRKLHGRRARRRTRRPPS